MYISSSRNSRTKYFEMKFNYRPYTSEIRQHSIRTETARRLRTLNVMTSHPSQRYDITRKLLYTIDARHWYNRFPHTIDSHFEHHSISKKNPETYPKQRKYLFHSTRIEYRFLYITYHGNISSCIRR
jgi:hypothetical protein